MVAGMTHAHTSLSNQDIQLVFLLSLVCLRPPRLKEGHSRLLGPAPTTHQVSHTPNPVHTLNEHSHSAHRASPQPRNRTHQHLAVLVGWQTWSHQHTNTRSTNPQRQPPTNVDTHAGHPFANSPTLPHHTPKIARLAGEPQPCTTPIKQPAHQQPHRCASTQHTTHHSNSASTNIYPSAGDMLTPVALNLKAIKDTDPVCSPQG